MSKFPKPIPARTQEEFHWAVCVRLCQYRGGLEAGLLFLSAFAESATEYLAELDRHEAGKIPRIRAVLTEAMPYLLVVESGAHKHTESLDRDILGHDGLPLVDTLFRDGSPERDVLYLERCRLIEDALAEGGLTKDEVEIFRLRFGIGEDQLSIERIAEVRGVGVQKVKIRVVSAFRKVKAYLLHERGLEVRDL